jgi:hypothetical protein
METSTDRACIRPLRYLFRVHPVLTVFRQVDLFMGLAEAVAEFAGTPAAIIGHDKPSRHTTWRHRCA